MSANTLPTAMTQRKKLIGIYSNQVLIKNLKKKKKMKKVHRQMTRSSLNYFGLGEKKKPGKMNNDDNLLRIELQLF
jgi:hypothetical protein